MRIDNLYFPPHRRLSWTSFPASTPTFRIHLTRVSIGLASPCSRLHQSPARQHGPSLTAYIYCFPLHFQPDPLLILTVSLPLDPYTSISSLTYFSCWDHLAHEWGASTLEAAIAQRARFLGMSRLRSPHWRNFCWSPASRLGVQVVFFSSDSVASM